MDTRTSTEVYLFKASAAEAIADNLTDGFLKRSWLDIAQGYRDLAQAEQDAGRAAAEQPMNPISLD